MAAAKRRRRWHVLWLWLALPVIAEFWPPCPPPTSAPDVSGRVVDSAAVALLFGERLDPNRASAPDLALLPGIGPVRATAISEHAVREPFARLEDLERVGGIGPKTAQQLAPWLEFPPVVADRHPTAQALPGIPHAAVENSSVREDKGKDEE
ncbi:MAG: helix-hairpin-helix domain-containing protein [Myxococcota bacterium]|nr:helix-hairpin-helix domain-containing protein [Myxococcota bacterium]